MTVSEKASSSASDELGAGVRVEPLLKRPFDFILALLGLLGSLPLWGLIAGAIWMEDGRPIFFSQRRVGLGGRQFKAWKFRSMIEDAEVGTGPVAAVQGDPRVTRVGKILRRTALDELPQVASILIGDMSFVGPRPDRPWEVEERDGDLLSSKPVEQFEDAPDLYRLIPGYQMRLSVRPGLTGLAQVYGSYDTPRRQKLLYDLLYIRKMSFWLDVRLILVSCWISLRGSWEERERRYRHRRQSS